MTISNSDIPAPAVPVKREAEADMTQVTTSIKEAPIIKRKKFFHTISTKAGKSLFDSNRGITTPDELSEPELQECYVIAKAALKAQFEKREVTPEVMEEFLGLVFQGEWTTHKSTSPVGELDRFPLNDSKWSATVPIGHVSVDGVPQEVTQRITLETDPPRLNFDHYRLTRLGGKNIQLLSMSELERMSWKPNADVRIVTRKLCRQALLAMTNTFAGYNRKRAVTYARDYLTHQAQGHPSPLGGRYTFASISLILNAFPLLDERELEDNGSTIVLFGAAEVRGWKGITARLGTQVLKT